MSGDDVGCQYKRAWGSTVAAGVVGHTHRQQQHIPALGRCDGLPCQAAQHRSPKKHDAVFDRHDFKFNQVDNLKH